VLAVVDYWSNGDSEPVYALGSVDRTVGDFRFENVMA
jgi:hypothetical protein